MTSLTLFFIVEPRTYQYFSCFLVATARRYLDPDIRIVGYCPEHRMGELDPSAVEALARMDCEVRPMQTKGVFDPPYPHGNKLAACLAPRDTDWGGFLDSDIVFVAPHDIKALLRPGHVTCSVATSIGWAPPDLWDEAYGAVGLPVPEERVRLSRNQQQSVPPDFSSGIVLFPETECTDNGQSFAELWMDTAQIVDRVPMMDPYRRPFLDQITLPVAMRRAGLEWNPMAERDHYILGGRLKHSAVPVAEEGITTVHYRHWGILEMADQHIGAQDALEEQIGVRRVRALVATEDTAGLHLDFDADRPAPPPAVHRDVGLVPWGNEEPGEARRAAGIFDAEGDPIAAGHCWRDEATPRTIQPDAAPDAPAERLEGRWLYGGMFLPAFGHFLSETTSRFWAADRAGDLDGVVFLPETAVRNERRLFRHQLPFLDALGLGHLQVRVPQSEVEIEELVLPEQGAGAGALAAGLPDYRDWVAGRIADIVAGDTATDRPADLFISRSAHGDGFEDTWAQGELDRLMTDAGYTVVHPQHSDLAEQVRSYRAARRIVALDGGALVLAAMSAGPDTRVCVIGRGPSGGLADHLERFRRFSGLEADHIAAIKGFHHPAGRRIVAHETRAVLDFARIGLTLATTGFIPTARGWDASFEATIAAECAQEERRLKTRLEWHRS